MIQNWGTGGRGQSASPAAIRVSESMNSAPPSPVRGPAPSAASAMTVSSRL